MSQAAPTPSSSFDAGAVGTVDASPPEAAATSGNRPSRSKRASEKGFRAWKKCGSASSWQASSTAASSFVPRARLFQVRYMPSAASASSAARASMRKTDLKKQATIPVKGSSQGFAARYKASRLTPKQAVGSIGRLRAEVLTRSVLVQHVPVCQSETKLIDFFNGALVAACGHADADYISAGPCCGCKFDDSKPGEAILSFRSEHAAIIALCLDGICCDGSNLKVSRPPGYKKVSEKADMGDRGSFWGSYRANHARWALPRPDGFKVEKQQLLQIEAKGSTPEGATSTSAIAKSLALGLQGTPLESKKADESYTTTECAAADNETFTQQMRRQQLDPATRMDIARLKLKRSQRKAGKKAVNLYDALGVYPDATRKQIREGYLKWIREVHPDRKQNKEQRSALRRAQLEKGSPSQSSRHAAEAIVLTRAYRTLLAPLKRRAHDNKLLIREVLQGSFRNADRRAFAFILKHLKRGIYCFQRIKITNLRLKPLVKRVAPLIAADAKVEVYPIWSYLQQQPLQLFVGGSAAAVDKAVEIIEGFQEGVEASFESGRGAAMPEG
eukprot:TRINITY_DN60331_c0_g1_i1.p1 TRINITY_DN60331_c0_g1~~TRINITY_DN60331_c0_g1_i1.p1  ORF type:complete len:558 (+),score=116.23 TRINITY_DN60331_c0_g1_i1:169-1842(+)